MVLEARAQMLDTLNIKLKTALSERGLDNSIAPYALHDLSMSSVALSYQQLFSTIPAFFYRLFNIYRTGHLPCGWEGDLQKWPSGRIVFY